MKRMEIEKVLTDFDGEPILLSEGGDALTLGDVVRLTLKNTSEADPSEAVRLYKLGCKMADFDGDLEDAEMELLVGAVEKNPVGFMAIVSGQVLELLNGVS